MSETFPTFHRWKAALVQMSRAELLRKAALSGLAIKIALAFCLARLGFWVNTSPHAFSMLGAVGTPLWRVIDAPASAVNMLAPQSLRSGVARQFSNSTYCFPRSPGVELARYLRVGVPGWLALLYVPAGIRRMRSRLRSRQRTVDVIQ
jgi:hypothetical protein